MRKILLVAALVAAFVAGPATPANAGTAQSFTTCATSASLNDRICIDKTTPTGPKMYLYVNTGPAGQDDWYVGRADVTLGSSVPSSTMTAAESSVVFAGIVEVLGVPTISSFTVNRNGSSSATAFGIVNNQYLNLDATDGQTLTAFWNRLTDWVGDPTVEFVIAT